MCSTEAKFPRLARGRGRGLLASDLQHAGLVIDAGWPAERAEACLCSVADAGAHEHTFGDSVNVMAFDPGFLLNGFSARHGTNWSGNTFNDDIMWACMAYIRGYQRTGNTSYRSIAKANFTALWSNPTDPGWGVAVSHRAQGIFAVLFTYDDENRPAWMVMSRGKQIAPGAFTGELYRV